MGSYKNLKSLIMQSFEKPRIWQDKLKSSHFRGKSVLLTGATSGIGQQTALEMAKRGAKIILGVRDMKKGLEVKDWFREQVQQPEIMLKELNLESLRSVGKFTKSLNEKVDILINNAGIYGIPFTLSKDENEMNFAVNYLAHFMLTTLLINSKKIDKHGKIVLVTGEKYKNASIHIKDWNVKTHQDYDYEKAYSNSKLAVSLFGVELNRRFGRNRPMSTSSRYNLSVYVVNPGVVKTNITSEILKNYPELVRQTLLSVPSMLMWTPNEGCQTILYCSADNENDLTSGGYYYNCKEEPWSSIALDKILATKCWNYSESLIIKALRNV